MKNKKKKGGQKSDRAPPTDDPESSTPILIAKEETTTRQRRPKGSSKGARKGSSVEMARVSQRGSEPDLDSDPDSFDELEIKGERQRVLEEAKDKEIEERAR